MTPGTLLCDTNFEYSDGTCGKKILVVLNDGSDYPYNVVKTTSRQKNRGTICGCQLLDRFQNFFLPKGCCFLNEHTWVQREDFRELETGSLLGAHFSGQIVRLAELPRQITVELLECAIKCDDISAKQQEILHQTLAVLKSQQS